jgi:Family of unknown function (DUF5670)
VEHRFSNQFQFQVTDDAKRDADDYACFSIGTTSGRHTVTAYADGLLTQELYILVVQSNLETKETYMFIVLFAVLLLAWLGGFLVFHVSGALIHILLLFAALSLIVHFFQRKSVS